MKKIRFLVDIDRIFLKFTWKGKRTGITDIINFEKKRIKYEESVYTISQIT